MRQIINGVNQFTDVRNFLCDEVSKEIYDAIVLYRLTGKYRYLHDIIRKYCRQKSKRVMDFSDLIERNRVIQKDDIVLFGAALFAHDIYNIFKEFKINISAVCDNSMEKQQAGFAEGIIVSSPKEIVRDMSNAIYVITAIDWFIKNDMRNELIGYGIPEENIIFALDYYGSQYFEEGLVFPNEKEIFVDGGSLDCITCVQFRNWCKGKYEKIYSFEPDENSFKNCENTINKYKLESIELLPYGLWDCKEILRFSNAKGGSYINDDGNSVINTISIDEVLNGCEVSFIKMDIEGAELRALMGAKETIKKWHPKLAISIYHKPEDLIELPLYIKSLSEDYKLYLRHYSSAVFETILYAL